MVYYNTNDDNDNDNDNDDNELFNYFPCIPYYLVILFDFYSYFPLTLPYFHVLIILFSLTHSLIQSFTHSLTHSLTQ